MSNNEPILPRPPLITSENQNWDGISLEHHLQPTFELPEHSHSEHLLVVAMNDGLKAEWLIDGQFRDLQYDKGDVFVIPAGATHKVYWKQPTEVILLTLKSESVSNTVADLVGSADPEIIPQFATPDLRLSQIAQWLLSELREPQMGSAIYIESFKTVLNLHLLRNYSTVEPKVNNHAGGLAPYKVQTAISYINENLDRNLKLGEMAGLFDMSSFYFARMFKESTGLAPHQYLVQQRLAKAKELLRYSKMAISDIGLSVGYKNPSHFAKVFRQHTQTTPTAYRNSF